jgi:hypothetical protein
MTAPERFAESQIPLAPRAPSIHDPTATLAAEFAVVHNAAFLGRCGRVRSFAEERYKRRREFEVAVRCGRKGNVTTRTSSEGASFVLLPRPQLGVADRQ